MAVNEHVFSQFPVMTTARLKLAGLEPIDGPELFKFYSSDESLRFIPRDIFDDPRQGPEKVKIFTRAFDDQEAIWWRFRLRSTGEFVGYGGLFDISTEDHNAEIGYGFHPEYWGRGFATEAVGTIVNYGFESLGLRRIFGLIDPENDASMHVLEKLGFEREGIMRDACFARDRYWDQCLFAKLG